MVKVEVVAEYEYEMKRIEYYTSTVLYRIIAHESDPYMESAWVVTGDGTGGAGPGRRGTGHPKRWSDGEGDERVVLGDVAL